MSLTMSLTALVDEGLRLQAEITHREIRLKEIEKALRAHAEAHPQEHVPLKDEDREGTRCIVAGESGRANIIFTSDLIMQSIPGNSPLLVPISDAAGEHMPAFYRRTISYDAVHVRSNKFDGKAFRAQARELLPDPEAFIAACIRRDKTGVPVSQTRIEWQS